MKNLIIYLLLIFSLISCVTIGYDENGDIDHQKTLIADSKLWKNKLVPFEKNKKNFNKLMNEILNAKKIYFLENSLYKGINNYFFGITLLKNKGIQKIYWSYDFLPKVDYKVNKDDNKYSKDFVENEINLKISEIRKIFKEMNKLNTKLIIKYQNRIEFVKTDFTNYPSLDLYNGYFYCTDNSNIPKVYDSDDKRSDGFIYIEKIDTNWYYFTRWKS